MAGTERGSLMPEGKGAATRKGVNFSPTVTRHTHDGYESPRKSVRRKSEEDTLRGSADGEKFRKRQMKKIAKQRKNILGELQEYPFETCK